MAKLSVTTASLTVILFLLCFALTHARIPLNLPANDGVDRRVQNLLPESDDINPTIRLPSEASTDEPSANGDSTAVSVTTVPLKVVRFRPINRHFRLRSTFPFRLCRHHHHHHHEFRQLRHRIEIPHGDDDMILSNGENSDFDPMIFHGGVRQMRPRWVRHHHHHHHHEDSDSDGENEVARFGFKDRQKVGKEKFRKRFHLDEDEDQEEEKENTEGGGFLKNFRKFLNQFEF